MDRESRRKRKRAEKAEAASRANNQIIDSKAAAAAKEEVGAQAASPPPTEEEVDEFFAILRRMRVAVKYFEKESGKSNGDELQISTAVDGVKVGSKRVVESGGLDLNAVPEAESS